MSCDKLPYKKAEQNAKAYLRTKGVINEFLNITDLPNFRKEVTTLTNNAKKYLPEIDIQKDRAFFEEDNGTKALPNTALFQAVDRAKGIFNQESDNIISEEEQNKKITSFNENFAKELQDKFHKLYPTIKFSYDNSIKEKGQANIEAMSILINALKQDQTTIPHEYVHNYIAWFRDTNIVQRGIKEFGSEEKLVQVIGEQVVSQQGKVNSFLQRFWNVIKSILGKDDVLQTLTDAFLQAESLSGMSLDVAQDLEIDRLQNIEFEDEKIKQNIWYQVDDSDNKLISNQYEHIQDLTTEAKEAAEKVMSFSKNLKVQTDNNYILKSIDGKSVTCERVTDIMKKDERFSFNEDEYDEDKYKINRQWGNQIDDIFKTCVLHRYDGIETKLKESNTTYKENSAKRGEDDLLSDNTIKVLVDGFDRFMKQNKDKIIIPQVFLYNESEKIAGTADIVIINSNGSVEVVDLKSSISAIGHLGNNNFRSYQKEGEDGNTYRNSYTTTFKGNTKGSKKQRHEAQLSMYLGMLESKGIQTNNTKAMGILPVHIKSIEGNFVEDVEVERNDFNLDVNQEYVNKVSVDNKYNGKLLDGFTSEFSKNVERIKLYIQNEIDILKSIGDKSSKIRINRLEKDLERFQDKGIRDANKIAQYVDELHKLFCDKEFGLTAKIGWEINQIKKGKRDNNEFIAIKNLSVFKNRVDFFRLLVAKDLTDLYTDIERSHRGNTQNYGEIKDSEAYKLKELVHSFASIDNDYERSVNPVIAKILSTYNISSDEVNAEADKYIKRQEEKLQQVKQKYEEKFGKNADNLGIIDTGKKFFLENKIKSLEDDIYKTKRDIKITYETILQQLNSGAYSDISFLSKWGLAPDASKSIFVGGFAKIVRETYSNAQHRVLPTQSRLSQAFENYAKTREKEGVSRNNTAEFNKPFYDKVTLSHLDENQKQVNEDKMAFVNEVDITKFNKAREEFLKTIEQYKDQKTDEGKSLWWEKYHQWYQENTETIVQRNTVINGVVIQYGIRDILEEKIKDRDSNLITKYEFDHWYNKAIIEDRQGNITANPLTKEGRDLRQPKLSSYTSEKYKQIRADKAKSDYYDEMISTYFKSNEHYVERQSHQHKYILPSIHKNDMDRFFDSGIGAVIKDKLNYVKTPNKEQRVNDYGEKTESQLKIIPSYYNNDMHLEDVSLDLAQSILKYDLMANLYSAQVELQPLAEALVQAVSLNKPNKTDSFGRNIVHKFSDKLDLPGLEKYVKSSESNTEALLKYYIDLSIYGITREQSKVNSPVGEIDMHQIVDRVSAIIGQTSLGLPFSMFTNTANWLQGEANVLIEAHAEQFFDKTTYGKAQAEYGRLFSDIIKDFSGPINKTLIGQLIDNYEPFEGEFRDKLGHRISKDKLKILMSSSPTFFLQNIGEHNVQLTGFLATLMATKVKDFDGKEMSLYEAYELNSNTKKLKIKDNIDLQSLGRISENGLVPLSIQSKVRSITRKMHGNYGRLSQPMIRKYWLGRIMEFFRKFMMPALDRRWRSMGYNFEEENVTEGYHRTFWRLFMNEYSELQKAGFGLRSFNSTKENTNLTDMEIANLRRNAMDIALIAITGGMTMILMGLMKGASNPDDKKKYAILLAPFMRMNMELNAYGSIGDPQKGFLPDINDVRRTIVTPTLMNGYAVKAYKFMSQVPIDLGNIMFSDSHNIQRYKRDTGIWKKGDSKLLADFLALFGMSPSKIDFTEQIKSLNMAQTTR